MNDIRAKFEEIWPVPRGIFWDESEYLPLDLLEADQKSFELACEWDARLDTFTRCQESMFSKEELNLFRQWFNAVEDLSPIYLEKSDCDLYRKVMERLK